MFHSTTRSGAWRTPRPSPFSSALVVASDPATASRMQRILGAFAPGRRTMSVSARAEACALMSSVPSFDLVLVDMQLPPPGEAAQLVAQLRASHPDAQVVAMSDRDGGDEAVLCAFAAGATGYLLNDAPDADIAHALRALESGGVALDARVARRVLGLFTASLRAQPRQRMRSPLSLRPRELEFLHLLADGLSNRQIADALMVSIHTVEFHARNTYRKLGVTSRTQAILEGTRHGLLD